jgi:hypothetical protein
MGRNPKFQHLTDDQIQEKRKKYMRDYYLNNKNKEIKLKIPKKVSLFSNKERFIYIIL